MRAKSALAGMGVVLKSTCLDLLTVAVAGHKDMVARAQNGAVLMGLRGAGFLHFRPGASGLLPLREDDPAAEFPGCSHRLDTEFLQDRLSWIDATGRPAPVDWSALSKLRQPMTENARRSVGR